MTSHVRRPLLTPMSGALVVALAASLLAAPGAHAQAPRVTPAGDPSVKSDTIYRLAVRPEDHPEESSMFLLDDGIVRLEADGRSRKTYRQVVQILKEDAVDNEQEQSFSYAPGHQRLTVNWIRVVKPNGEIVSAKPTHMQESDVPAEMGDPVYSDTRVIRASLSGVAVGTLVDYSYTIEELKPPRPGDFYSWWGISTGLAVGRSRFIVDVPATMKMNIHERNLRFTRGETVVGGRRVFTWAAKDLPRIKPEPFASDSNTIYMSVAVSAPSTWHDVGAWYASLARGRYTLGPSATAKVRSLVSDARTRDDSIRAVHKWVAQDIRYVSIDLGAGGYQPRTPDTVVATGLGDCKDKATLFVAALGSIGIKAYPVLLSSSGGVDRSVPSKDQFDHVIAAVASPAAASGYTYVDLTSDLTPYGELPYSEQGSFGLVVHPDGQTEEITFPQAPITANFSRDIITGSLSDAGTLDLHWTAEAGGANGSTIRQIFVNPMDSTTRDRFTRAIAGKLYSGAAGDSLVGFKGKDLSVQPRFSVHLRRDGALSHSGGMDILLLPVQPPRTLVDVANQLAALPPRQFPIEARAVVGPTSNSTDLRITLPAGWTARLPAPVHAAGPFGIYDAQYSQVGREFRLTRTMTGVTGVLPPNRVNDLVAWFRAVGADDAQFIVLERKGTPSGQ